MDITSEFIGFLIAQNRNRVKIFSVRMNIISHCISKFTILLAIRKSISPNVLPEMFF